MTTKLFAFDDEHLACLKRIKTVYRLPSERAAVMWALEYVDEVTPTMTRIPTEKKSKKKSKQGSRRSI